MTPTDKTLKQEATIQINQALRLCRGQESYVAPPNETVTCGSYRMLDRFQCDQGVVALVLACNLSGGSVNDVDLYKLVRTYLWDECARAEINAVVKRHGL
ncbi:hypothetical protein [Massilia glaciei]|uniref:Uncharacterized protein n=1 Tax=Massilia glaciei TaxID=1524097 RepID=A0A2U2HGG2_9BURK|nr:hypothetical protein [Massilia glaciei]PWF44005.1 hypothetical protein C7C56_019905 [Massilia glaciei]